jgi:hypothetical protein
MPSKTPTTKHLSLTRKERTLVAAPVLILRNAEDATLLAERIAERKALLKDLRTRINKIKDPINQARAAILAEEKLTIKPLEAGIDADVKRLVEWRDEDRRRRLAEHATQSAQSQIEAEQKKAASLSDVRAAAQQIADPEAKAAILGYADTMASLPSVVPVEAFEELPLPEGLIETSAGGWSATVTDLPAFLMAVLEGTIPFECVSVNQGEINRHATAMKELLAWPGVTVHPPKRTLAAR